jgi:hypothetical protein
MRTLVDLEFKNRWGKKEKERDTWCIKLQPQFRDPTDMHRYMYVCLFYRYLNKLEHGADSMGFHKYIL